MSVWVCVGVCRYVCVCVCVCCGGDQVPCEDKRDLEKWSFLFYYQHKPTQKLVPPGNRMKTAEESRCHQLKWSNLPNFDPHGQEIGSGLPDTHLPQLIDWRTAEKHLKGWDEYNCWCSLLYFARAVKCNNSADPKIKQQWIQIAG